MLMREIEVAIVYLYIYNTNCQHYFLSKLKFMHNPNFTFCNDTFDGEVRR
jgi:hypothetical protein